MKVQYYPPLPESFKPRVIIIETPADLALMTRVFRLATQSNRLTNGDYVELQTMLEDWFPEALK